MEQRLRAILIRGSITDPRDYKFAVNYITKLRKLVSINSRVSTHLSTLSDIVDSYEETLVDIQED
jgi:hypothetical protein